jgi:hypothetical protein
MSVYQWSFAPGVRKTSISANKIRMVLGVMAAATLLLGLCLHYFEWENERDLPYSDGTTAR